MLETGAGLMSWDGTYMMAVMEPLEFPVVNPWQQVQEVIGPGEYLFVRNPYYFKIDTAGNQLPYIDYIRKSTAEDPEVPSPCSTAANSGSSRTDGSLELSHRNG